MLAGAVRPPAGARGGGRGRRVERAAAGAARRADRRRWRRGRRRSSSGSASGSRASTARPPPAGWSSCCRPAWVAAGGATGARGSSTLAAATAAGRAALGDGTPARARASAPRSRGSPAQRPAPSSRPASSRRTAAPTAQALERLEARGLVEPAQRAQRPAAARSWTWAPRRRRPRLTAEQRAALDAVVAAIDGAGAPRAPPPRGHGLGQDRGLPGGRRGGARAGQGRDRAGPRDRADAAGDVAVRVALRRPRRAAALAAGRRRAPRRVAAPARRRGADLRRAALGGLRPGARPGPGGDRRGARRLLQAGGRPALRRPRGRPAAGGRGRSGAASPAAPRRGRRAGWRCRGFELPRRADGSDLPAGRGGRHAARRRRGRRAAAAGPLRPRIGRRSAEVREARAKAIVLAQPARLVAVRLLPLLRAGLGVPALRRLARPPQAAASAFVCHHCGHAEPVPDVLSGLRLGRRSRATAPGPSAWPSLLARRVAPLPGLPARLRQRRRARRTHVEILRRFEQAPSGVLVGTQMVAKGHDFPDVVLSVVLDADATLRFPDFRAEERTFALVAQLAGRSGRGERGGRVLVQTLAPDAPGDSPRRGPRRRGLPGRRARAPPGASLPAVLAPGADRADVGETQGALRRPRRRFARRLDAGTAGRHRAAGAGASLPAARPPPPPAPAQGRAPARSGGRGPRRRRGDCRGRASCAASRVSVDVDPQ